MEDHVRGDPGTVGEGKDSLKYLERYPAARWLAPANFCLQVSRLTFRLMRRHGIACSMLGLAVIGAVKFARASSHERESYQRVSRVKGYKRPSASQ